MAFPVAIGIAMVVGVIMSYALQPKGDPMLLALGVALAIVAVIMDGKAYGRLTQGRPGRLAQEHHRLHRLGRAHGLVRARS